MGKSTTQSTQSLSEQQQSKSICLPNHTAFIKEMKNVRLGPIQRDKSLLSGEHVPILVDWHFQTHYRSHYRVPRQPDTDKNYQLPEVCPMFLVASPPRNHYSFVHLCPFNKTSPFLRLSSAEKQHWSFVQKCYFKMSSVTCVSWPLVTSCNCANNDYPALVAKAT